MNLRSINTFVKLILSVTCLTSTLVTAKENTSGSEDNKKSIETKQALYKTVDANGNITSTPPPEKTKKDEIKLEDIEISVPKGGSVSDEDPVKQGIVSFSQNEFCIVSAPPWVKYESMVYWYENLCDDPDFDIHEYIIENGKKIFCLYSN